ncbi:MCE family protein [Nocardioides lianchengensis]|uniref:Phospholipid/cholesterol/gamma-HCH transport system substrate-binding protein n=1 Tax=Nocardioides lianchengensis TaxID=1045774 RepID=A0A1G7B6N2_9ACTN|nr:MlaD family protein [Nocardioides lianchengensis]NYG10098.1 phospholipid/cholesterol/gamma-HCH transport system substrate-binding protein [Nocardioides lianchengensis]SDE22632.1 phospholipid/cholesterol/gamma-HCH transport system substrate-binding protein [Nocardioides lianchengensis]
MLTTMTRAKVVVFVVLSLLTTTFLAVQYVGLDRFLGGYQVSVDLPQAGGLFENSEVTYRGVPVGRVESLTASRDGAHAVLRIERGAPDIPAEVQGRVVNRSAIGEQYLDLRGGEVGDELLADGAHLTLTAADLPPSIDGLLRSSRDFVASVPSDALNTVIDEGYEMSRGNGAHLARLIETSSDFAQTADRNFLVTVSLIDSSGTVLATQEKAAASFTSFSSDLRLLAHALDEQDDDWRRLVEQTPAAARQLDALFRSVGQPLGQLMGNLVSTAQVFGTHAAGVKETLIRLPEGISITYAVMTSKGMRSGLQTSFFTPLPCTDGYEKTEMRPGTDTSPGQKFNPDAGCDADPSTGSNVRGPGATLPGDDRKKGGRRTTVLAPPDSMDDLLGGTQ